MKTVKKKKGKAAKKAMKFGGRKENAAHWIAAYDGTKYNGDIIKAYRKKFAVSRMKAVHELQLLGVALTREQILSPVHEDQNDMFFYIAGYTSGGTPYGVTGEEMGLGPWEEL